VPSEPAMHLLGQIPHLVTRLLVHPVVQRAVEVL
jgi:hypothetical protein